jgi:predicted methyltransferase MtxX (methanogen marker protein 4)
VRHLKDQLSQQEEVRRSSTDVGRQDSSAQAMQLINQLVDSINKIVAEGINYHKALFEVRDATGMNRRALQAMTLKAQVCH